MELDRAGQSNFRANGVSEQGEVKPVAGWAIVAISTRYIAEDESDVYIAASPAGVTFRDGTTRPTYEVLLHRHPASVRGAADAFNSAR